MGILDLNYADFEKFLFVLTRVSALLLFAPIIGSGSVPVKLKIGLILLLSFLVAPLVGPFEIPEHKGLFSLSVYLFTEISIGLLIALIARLVFIAVQVGGTLVDFQMGFGVVNVIDPQTESQVSITAQFFNILATLIFLVLDAHHFFIQAIAESFRLLNPGKFYLTGLTFKYLLNLFSASFVVAIKFAAPIMAALFFISVALGLVARTVPQMNVFIVGFPLQIGIGLLILWFSLYFFSMLFQRQVMSLPASFVGLMQTM